MEELVRAQRMVKSKSWGQTVNHKYHSKINKWIILTFLSGYPLKTKDFRKGNDVIHCRLQEHGPLTRLTNGGWDIVRKLVRV